MREEAWQTGCAACQRRCVINVLNRQRTFHVPCLPLPLLPLPFPFPYSSPLSCFAFLACCACICACSNLSRIYVDLCPSTMLQLPVTRCPPSPASSEPRLWVRAKTEVCIVALPLSLLLLLLLLKSFGTLTLSSPANLS